MRLPAMPVRSGMDATLNFDKLAKLAPTFVSSLPPQPSDGQEVYFQNEAMAGLGVVWHLRYRAASASTHKWEFVGGAPLGTAYAGLKEAKATEAEEELPGGPKLTVPLVGEYEVLWAERLAVLNVAGAMNLEVTIRANVVPKATITHVASAQFGGSTLAGSELLGLAAGEALSVGIRQNAAKSASYLAARIMLLPLKVG